MNKEKEFNDDAWDVKQLSLHLGGEESDKGNIQFQIFDDSYMNIESNDTPGSEWCYEEISLDAARRLRDFLIYAVPDKKGNEK